MNIPRHSDIVKHHYQAAAKFSRANCLQPVKLDGKLQNYSCYLLMYFFTRWLSGISMDGTFSISQFRTSKLLNYSTKSISEAIEKLIRNNHIVRVKQGSIKERSGSMYRLANA